MEGAKIWAAVLIAAGVVLIIAAFIVNHIGFGRVIDAAIWENGIALLMFGLGIVFVVIGSVVKGL